MNPKPHRHTVLQTRLWAVVLAGLAACSEETTATGSDATARIDTGVVPASDAAVHGDAAAFDAAVPDAAPADANQEDTGSIDASGDDALPSDAGSDDGAAIDAFTEDAGSADDAASADVVQDLDAAAPDTSAPEAGVPDAVPGDAAALDAAPTDAGSPDSGLNVDGGGRAVWAYRLTGNGDQQVSRVTVDSAGNVVCLAFTEVSINLGHGTLRDAFILRLDGATGAYARSIEAPTAWPGSDQTWRAIGTAGTDVIIAAGDTDGAAVARLDADGVEVFRNHFTDASYQQGLVALDGSGNTLTGGGFSTALDFGGGPVTSAGGSDALLAKLSPNGTEVWVRRYGGLANEWISAATTTGNDVLVVGQSEQGITLGTQPLPAGMFAARINAAGGHVWSSTIANPTSFIDEIEADSSGNLIIFGQNGLGTGVHLVKLSPLGSRIFDVAVPEAWAGGLAVAPSGAIFITGQTGGAPSARDIYLSKYSAAGVHLWTEYFRSPAGDMGFDAVADANGDVIISGVYRGTINFGTGPLTAVADEGFVVKLRGD